MTTYRYANRAKAQLAQALTARDTTLTLVPGSGALFPETPHDNDQFALTLTSVSTPEQYEICLVLHRDGDTLTLRRGQENTTPQAFASGDIASLNMTAGLFSLFPQAGYMGVFDQDIANRLGGYRKNAIVCDPDTPGLLWVSTQDHNTTPPTADTSGLWLTLSAGGAYLSGTEGMVPGDLQGIGLHTRGGDNAVLYKDSSNNWRALALNSDLDTERQARQAEDTTLHTTTAALEQNKVSRSGDTMSGPLSVTDGNGNGLTLGTGTLTNAAGKMWQYGTDGSLTSPGGGVLPEMLGMNGRVVIQTFVATGDGENGFPTVTFPHSFQMGTVPMVFTQINNEGTHHGVSRVSPIDNFNRNQPSISNTGFIFQSTYIASIAETSGQPWTLQVLAIGVM